MNFLVVTLAPTLFRDGVYHSYAPYVKEMNVWFDHVDTITIISPTRYDKPLLTAPFKRNDIQVVSIPWIQFSSFLTTLRSLLQLPLLFFSLLKAMHRADHIHLRCPGTISLLGCIAQVFFPKKPKTAKYAGNWDPDSKQPLSYRLQKYILSATSLTKNMKVLVYGQWPNQSDNIYPFFTASYPKEKIPGIQNKTFKSPYHFLFIGALAKGKRPLYAIQLIEKLYKNGIACYLDLYGDGAERVYLEKYVAENSLQSFITFHGNQSAVIVEEAYKKSRFLVLPSQSEGWPKVVAEAMFWGVVPFVTPISCVPWMLGSGSRGLLLEMDLDTDKLHIAQALKDPLRLQELSQEGQKWSQEYTLDYFEAEIIKLVRS